MDALNKPLRTVAIRTIFFSLAHFLFVGGFVATVLVMSANFSGHNADVVIYLTIVMSLITQFMFSYAVIIWNIQVNRDIEIRRQ